MKINFHKLNEQSGAALVTVLFISLLLLTASVATLTEVASNSRNTTDVLSETKAYYAAETGLQATINVLRNRIEGDGTSVTYPEAVASPANMSTWLTYSGVQVPIGTGTGTGYSIQVSNPDSGGAITYSSAGKFTSAASGEAEADGGRLCIPDCAVIDGTSGPRTGVWTKITISGSAGTPTTPNTPIATFTLENGPNGAAANAVSNATFRIDYRLFLTPRVGVAPIYGKITQTNPSSPFVITFGSPEYMLFGTRLRLCETSTTASPCPTVTLNLSAGTNTKSFYGNYNAGALEPYRLVISSTGYGPNGAKKKLEGIVRRNLFDGYDPPATMALLGPNTDTTAGVTRTFLFDPGSVGYRGCDCDTSSPGCTPSLCVPAFGVTNATNLSTINSINTATGINVQRGSYLLDLDILPLWVQTPLALDEVISRLRVTAQHSNRYFADGANINNPGSFASGTGITFCEGECTVYGDGGGLLVSRGQLNVTGNFNFKGMILITGYGGWRRTGGGSGQVTGNIVIAPYLPNPTFSSTFLPPRYDMNGGGGSVVPISDINPFINNTSAISDVLLGVAEK